MNISQAAHRRGNILIVDDLPDNLHVLAALLGEQGYEVRPALNGRRALEGAYAEPPDLILLDIMMPEMDGYEVCEALKADSRTRDIPVIFISGLNGTLNKVKAFSVGAIDYITKPFQAQEVLVRVQTHLKYQQQRKQLEMANKELEEFTSMLSHDLKTPLRGINQLAHFLAQDYAENLDDDGKAMLRLLSERTTRMNNLLEGILSYSRACHAVRSEQVDLQSLVTEVVATLSPPEHIQMTIQSRLPVVTGNSTCLTRLFQNLIGNAIKYMDKPAGTIAIDCVEEETHWIFHIADNGPGIEPNEYENIFRMFRTAAKHDEQESTGIGLAIVKKIVESHGGQIWVESTVGQGSTFSFTLPKRSF